MDHDYWDIANSAYSSEPEEEENDAALSDEENPNEDDEEDVDGGQQHPRGIGKSARAQQPRPQETEEELLTKMTPVELTASYTSYAMAHAAEVEGGSSGSAILARLSFLRAELEKRCILDILFPLLAHINPCVQLTAAVDILSLFFEQSDQALSVLHTLRKGGKGVIPFIAGVALDTYVHQQFEEVPKNLMQEASSLYTGLHHSIRLFNANPARKGKLTPAESLFLWDGKEHRGTFISIKDPSASLAALKAYGQHVGMGHYQIYKADQLDRAPNDGERYIVRKGGVLEYEKLQEYARSR